MYCTVLHIFLSFFSFRFRVFSVLVIVSCEKYGCKNGLYASYTALQRRRLKTFPPLVKPTVTFVHELVRPLLPVSFPHALLHDTVVNR
jgi:hypothetical protein